MKPKKARKAQKRLKLSPELKTLLVMRVMP